MPNEYIDGVNPEKRMLPIRTDAKPGHWSDYKSSTLCAGASTVRVLLLRLVYDNLYMHVRVKPAVVVDLTTRVGGNGDARARSRIQQARVGAARRIRDHGVLT